ncbi:hypothetical protein BASA81_001982 [Batrachochytrium salamandrivorans]|nr:hypothetical protein BASA81_001982 [Batrachochytrium salamandrivorans]
MNSNSALLVPPLNYSMVMPGIYRSGFFNSRNYRFLLHSQHIKTIMHLSTDEYTEHKIGKENAAFIKANGIQFFTCKLTAHKEPFGHTDAKVVANALQVMLDRAAA